MKIFVCLKQVPDTETKIKIAGDGVSIDSTGIKWVVNPYDEYAIEEAVKVKEKNAGAQVFAIGLGPKKRVPDSLRTALAMGADEAICVDAPENLDSLAVAHYLAQAIKAEGGADLIFTGKTAIDDNASCVSQMVAELLNIPHTSVVSSFEKTDGAVLVERETEGGTKEKVELRLPALVAATKGLNMPRYASLPGIMKAKKKVIKEVDSASLGAQPVHTQITSLQLPKEKPAVKMLSGDAKTQVTELVKLLRDEAKVL